jgi:uncharacterized oxidoreductase
MQMTGNTMLITGGGSGIGQALAEAFHKLGNQVIIAGRRRGALEEVTAANPGMKSAVLDIENSESIQSFAGEVGRRFPSLNVLINNAGIMQPEDLRAGKADLAAAERMVTTNLLGPMRLTAALLPLLQRQPKSVVMTVSSGLAFVPLSITPTYCATKAGIHSWTMSLRYQLRQTTTQVIELVPPYVQTQLMGEGQASDPRAMPLSAFISEVMSILKEQPDVKEVCVERVNPLRFAAESGKLDATFNGLNEAMPAPH